MLTYFLGDEEVTAYCRDLVSRLTKLNDFPTYWFALGLSGRKVVDRLLELLPPPFRDQVVLGVAYLDRVEDKILFSDKTPFEGVNLRGKSVLLIDAAVHSGRSMYKLATSVQAAGAEEITSYTLVLKRGAMMIPTFFGVIIDDKDRIYFDLPVLPNNRLASPAPCGVLRAMVPSDVERAIVEVPAPFIGMTVGDLVYDQETHDAHVYIFEYKGEIVGFVNFRKLGSTLFIDGWYGAKRTTPDGAKMKIGSSLFRWTETWARSSRCDRIKLWAYEGAIATYEFMGFKPTETDWRTLSSGQRYRVMERKILYNIQLAASGELEYR